MAREIVTSENKAEYDESKLSPSVKRAYASDLKEAEKATAEAKDRASHFSAQLAHQRASIFAHPPENIEKHLEQARHHKKESAKHAAIERKAYIKERLSNDSKKHAEFMKKGDEKRRKAGTL